MICTFTKDITTDSIDATLDNFFENNNVSDLDQQTILERVLSDAFDLETWSDGAELVKCIYPRDKENLLYEIEARTIAYMREDIHERLRS